MKPFQRLLAAGLLAPLLIAAPLAHAASAATGFAQIDGSSITVNGLAGTQFSLIGHEAAIYFADNVVLPVAGGTPYVLGASDAVSAPPALQASRVDTGLGRLLSGQVDLVTAQQISGQFSRVNGGSTRFDDSNASWMLLLRADAGGQVRVTGNYLLGLTAAVEHAGDQVNASAFADVRLYDPGSGQILFDDERPLTIDLGPGVAQRTASRTASGSFDDLITLPAGRDVRLFFTASSGATTAAAVPEPQTVALLSLGLLTLWLRCRMGRL